MKLKDVFVKEIILFEGVKVSSGILQSAIEKSKLQMGFEVELIFEDSEIDLTEIDFSDTDEYFYNEGVPDTPNVVEFIRNNFDELFYYEKNDIIEQYFEDWKDSNPDWY